MHLLWIFLWLRGLACQWSGGQIQSQCRLNSVFTFHVSHSAAEMSLQTRYDGNLASNAAPSPHSAKCMPKKRESATKKGSMSMPECSVNFVKAISPALWHISPNTISNAGRKYERIRLSWNDVIYPWRISWKQSKNARIRNQKHETMLIQLWIPRNVACKAEWLVKGD